MANDELLQAARDTRRVASILREKCTGAAGIDEATRQELSGIIDATVLDLRWIVGRNYGSETLVAEVEAAAAVVPDAAVVVDVGANAGNWSRVALQMFPNAAVIAFEPQGTHEPHLAQLVAEQPSRFRFKKLALSDASGSAPLYANEAGSGLASLYQRDLRRFYGVEMNPMATVETSTLAEEMRLLSLDAIDVLKIDVEGHELSVLKGASPLITRVKYIQFEFGGAMMDSKVAFRDIMSFFADLPFRLFRLSPVGLIAIPAYNEGLEGYEMSNYIAINHAVAIPG